MRDFLPAVFLAIAGLGVLTAFTFIPKADEPAIVVFGTSLSQEERLIRVVRLGGMIMGAPQTGQTIYATFENLPSFEDIRSSGVIAILNAEGARGCTIQEI